MNLPNVHITKSVIAGLIVATALLHFLVIPLFRQALPVVGDVRLEGIEKTPQSITLFVSGKKKRDCLIIAHQAMIEHKGTTRYKYRPHYNFKFDDSDEPIHREKDTFFGRQFFSPWVWELTLEQSSDDIESVLLLTQHLCTTDSGTSGAIVHSSFGPFSVR